MVWFVTVEGTSGIEVATSRRPLRPSTAVGGVDHSPSVRWAAHRQRGRRVPVDRDVAGDYLGQERQFGDCLAGNDLPGCEAREHLVAADLPAKMTLSTCGDIALRSQVVAVN